ncbi:hypothetical protein N0V90_004815 [Kalmusia sp. IMI 367209]|nr:hypothetical protein N0V90_004815 [Kalmusia sp. IMI 367209]
MRPRNALRRKAPACTHVSMERIPLSQSGYDQCPSCGSYRTLGFLYVCRQECDIAYVESISGGISDDGDKTSKSTLRRELEHIRLSESVITAAEQGLYTHHQLGKLKAQKTKLNRVIADVLAGVRAKDTPTSITVNANEPSNNDGAFSSIPTIHEPTPSCNLLACHACRPYFRDRISMSFEAVFSDQIRPFHPREADFLPVKSSQIMRDIGVRPVLTPLSLRIDATPTTLLTSPGYSEESSSTPSQSSMFTYKTTQSEIDTLNTTRHHRRRFYRMGHRSSGEIGRDLSRLPLFSRQGLMDALKGVFRASRESSSSGSNITLPMPRTAAARDSGDASMMGEFDMGALRRVRRQKERQDLRNGLYTSGFEDVNGPLRRQHSSSHASRGDGESDSSGSMISVYSCVSDGSEVEVEGGVALTEEAVETHTPDIISDPDFDPQSGAGRSTQGLESIMTQV